MFFGNSGPGQLQVRGITTWLHIGYNIIICNGYNINNAPYLGAGTRSIRRRTIRRGLFVADYSSHGQFVARTIRRKTIRRIDNLSHGQFVAKMFSLICI